MKRIYKSCVAVLLLLAMLLSCVPALAAGSSHSYTTLQKAEALKTLGLFQGTNKGFELEKTLTREQAITLIVHSSRSAFCRASNPLLLIGIPPWATRDISEQFNLCVGETHKGLDPYSISRNRSVRQHRGTVVFASS